MLSPHGRPLIYRQSGEFISRVRATFTLHFSMKLSHVQWGIPQTRHKGSTFFPQCWSRWWIRHMLTNGVIFFTLKHTDPHAVRSWSTKKDGVCNERVSRNGSFRELKIAKESNDLAEGLPESYQKSNEFSVNRKNRRNVATDDRRTFAGKDKVYSNSRKRQQRFHVGLRKWLSYVTSILITNWVHYPLLFLVQSALLGWLGGWPR